MSDDLDGLGTPPCPVCGELLEAVGNVREVDRNGVLVAEGSAYWRCSRDGFSRLF